jgi:small subunit ribosomal protein S19e
MVCVKDVNQSDYVVALAAFFKKQGRMAVPKWSDYGKTNTGKMLSPLDNDWFYIRTAAIARQLYCKGTVGVGRFSKMYGMGVNNGMRPGSYRKGNGHIARFALQELEKMKFVTKGEKGRKLTKEGQQALDRIASTVAKA